MSLVEDKVEKEKLTLPFTYHLDMIIGATATSLFYDVDIFDILSTESFQEWLSDNELQVSHSDDDLLFDHKPNNSLDTEHTNEFGFDAIEIIAIILTIPGIIALVIIFAMTIVDVIRLLSIFF